MKNKTLYLLSIVLFFSCSCYGQLSKKETDISQMIKSFYVSYASNFANDYDTKNNDALLTENMTSNLIDKVHRMRAATQGDPIIRAQDFNLRDINSFDVKHLEGEWYMVSYIDEPDKKTRIEIPVRARSVNGKLLIDYITPHWNNSLFGDSIMCVKETIPQKIDASTPMSFLKTFYAAYINEYCCMPSDLSYRLNVFKDLS